MWLRKNIVHDWRDEPDGSSQEFWIADEVCGMVDHVPEVAEIEDDFDGWWDAFERAAMTDEEKIREAYDLAERAAAQAWFTAVITDTEVGE